VSVLSLVHKACEVCRHFRGRSTNNMNRTSTPSLSFKRLDALRIVWICYKMDSTALWQRLEYNTCKLTECGRQMGNWTNQCISINHKDWTLGLNDDDVMLDLSVFARHPSAVPRDHGTGDNENWNSLSKLMSFDWERMSSWPSKFLSALMLTVFCLLVE